MDAPSEDDRESPTEKTALEEPVVVPNYMRNVPIKKIHHPADQSILPSVLVSTAFVVAGLAFGLPVVAALTVVMFVVSGVRFMVAGFCTSRYGLGCIGCTSFVSATDAYWLHDSNFNRYVSYCLFFVERGLDVNTAREILKSRVIDKTTESGKRAFPRFTQKIMFLTSGYCWVDDNEFDIEKHMFEEARCVRTRHQLREFISYLMCNQPLAKNRPLWEVRMIKNFGSSRDTVLIVRVHHVISDGVAFVKILGNYLADHPQNLRMKPRWGGTTFPLNAFRAAVISPLTLLTWLWKRRDYNPLSHRQPLSGRRSVAWSLGIRFSTVDRIRQITHCTVNDILMAAARGAVRDYFKYHCGLNSPPNVTANLPVDLRFESSSQETLPGMGTGFTTVNTRLPTNTEGAIPGLWETHRYMETLKSSADAVVMYGSIHYLLTLLPTCLGRWLLRSVVRTSTLSFSSLPGPERSVTFASCRLKSVALWMDSHPDVPLAFCVLSYAGYFHLTVSADSGTVHAPGPLLKSFVAHIDRLYSIVAKRKIPGLERRRSSFTAERRWEEIVKPSVNEIQTRLQAVQSELHELARKLELLSLPGCAPDPSQVALYKGTLSRRMEELKEEFVELITELRKRKNLVANAAAQDLDEAHFDHDLDGQLRRPRRLSDARRPSGLNAFSTLLSTSRPLLTQYGPPGLNQCYNLYNVPSDPDLEARRTPELQRALLNTSRHSQDHQSFSGRVSYRRENLF